MQNVEVRPREVSPPHGHGLSGYEPFPQPVALACARLRALTGRVDSISCLAGTSLPDAGVPEQLVEEVAVTRAGRVDERHLHAEPVGVLHDHAAVRSRFGLVRDLIDGGCLHACRRAEVEPHARDLHAGPAWRERCVPNLALRCALRLMAASILAAAALEDTQRVRAPRCWWWWFCWDGVSGLHAEAELQRNGSVRGQGSTVESAKSRIARLGGHEDLHAVPHAAWPSTVARQTESDYAFDDVVVGLEEEVELGEAAVDQNGLADGGRGEQVSIESELDVGVRGHAAVGWTVGRAIQALPSPRIGGHQSEVRPMSRCDVLGPQVTPQRCAPKCDDQQSPRAPVLRPQLSA